MVRKDWTLYGQVYSYETTKVFTAMAGADGMCRPLGYQAFVYSEGRYAGTLSPVPIDSRTNSSLINACWMQRVLLQSSHVTNPPIPCAARQKQAPSTTVSEMTKFHS